MKRVFALLLALIMVMSLATTAFAAEDQSNLTVNTTGYTSRTFNAYRILTATNEGTKYNYEVVPAYRDILVGILGVETANKTTAQIDAAIVEAIGLKSAEDMTHFANDLYRAVKADSTITADISGWNGNKRAVNQGYWMIVDVTDLTDTNESNSLVILDTAGDSDVTVNLKADTTITTKKVDDENDSIYADIAGNEDGQNWQDTSDYDIGDKVPYRLTGQLSNDVASYNYYSFKIVDTVSVGLTHLPNTAEETNIVLFWNGTEQSIKAKGEAGDADWIYEIDSTNRTMTIYPNYGYTRNDGNKVEASAANGGDVLKLFDGVTDHDKINSSTYTLLYNCELNENAVPGNPGNANKAKVVVSNNPYGDGFGETPEETTITFTYSFIVNKVDPQGQPLTGAEFKLYKFVAEGKDSYSGTETVANTAEEAAKNGTYFNHPAANSYGKFVEVEHVTVNTAGTQFTFKGIDDGYYALIETEVPDGYKAIETVEFHVVATHITDLTGNPATRLTDLHAVFKGGVYQNLDGDETAGTLTAVIENRTGSELPSTGGMGTTLFYVLGGLMVASALVLLITKKRMSVN